MTDLYRREVTIERELALSIFANDVGAFGASCPFCKIGRACLLTVPSCGGQSLSYDDGMWICLKCKRGGNYYWNGESSEDDDPRTYSYLLELAGNAQFLAKLRIKQLMMAG